ncbi:HRDC domain-containing protein [Nakamurella aerolata]|uniref:Ribonuclease D n=1 Tax=Nakamurella aerolata TaxID=1656892 RepID=A0A849AAS8_9ACTN|nr:HRDC domain-containing protein [Nakamurella aerolata]NNG37635.1 ribonuclease D [Nakamurella aerolata]
MSESSNDSPSDQDAAPPIPLTAPESGFRGPLTDVADLAELAAALGTGAGPIALDAERASGFRYSARAYLVQLRRDDVGTVLLDPIALGSAVADLAEPLHTGEWILHAAKEDLPCLAELGLRPDRLFDTEVAARLAGLPKVGLGALVEQLLGRGLAKGHGAEDWSSRPLPESWLVYAALDVELLDALRVQLTALLREQGKWEWAQQEFAALAAAGPPAPRAEPWRRVSGLSQLKDRRGLAVARELWQARDQLAAERDIAPHRVLPDAAIVAAASRPIGSADELAKVSVFGGRSQRRQLRHWFDAVQRGRRLPDGQLPVRRPETDAAPPPGRWERRDPDAAARLAVLRDGLDALAERWSMPVENLVTPSLARQVLWDRVDPTAVPDRLTAGGARPWQVELVTPVLRDALATR